MRLLVVALLCLCLLSVAPAAQAQECVEREKNPAAPPGAGMDPNQPPYLYVNAGGYTYRVYFNCDP